MSPSSKQGPVVHQPVLDDAAQFAARFELDGDAEADSGTLVGTDTRTGQPVRVRRAAVLRGDTGVSLVYELAFCSRVEHPAVPKMLFVSAAKNGLTAVFSRPSGDTLERIFAKSGTRSSELDVLRHGLEMADIAAAAHAARFLVLEIGPAGFIVDSHTKRLHLDQATVCLPLESPAARERLRDMYVGGVWGYMAPEQITDVAELGPHTDVFAVGATLFRLLTGRPIYDSDSMKEAISQTRNAKVPDIAKVRKSISPKLADLVARCLAKSPKARFASAQDLAVAIRGLLHHMGARQSAAPPNHKTVSIPDSFPPEATLQERLRGHVDQTMTFVQAALDGTNTAESDRQHAAHLAKEREHQEHLQREQEAREKAERERLDKEHAAHLAKEREHQEHLQREQEAREKAERERLDKERAETERKEREHQEHLKREQEAREKAERERLEQARLQTERARQPSAPNGERGPVPKEVLEKAASRTMTPSPQQGNLTGGRVMATQPSAANAQKSESQEPRPVPVSEIQPRLHAVPADRYQIRRDISLGGEGACKIVFDQLADREVVLKASSPQGGWAAERIIKEARYAAKFNHPNVSRLLELGAIAKDQVFMTMPLVEGSSLDLVLKRISEAGIPGLTGYSMLAVAELFEKVCAGVEHAHSAGILHLDLKPQNIVVGSRGEVVVVDWGLAQPISAAELPKRYASNEQQGGAPSLNTTLTGSLASDASVRAIGTPAYMAPEQWAGDPGTFTERTDVYGLGGVLFYLLAGCAPNQVQRPTDLDPYFRHSPTPLPSDFTRRRVPPELEALCVKCLSRDPAQRYPSAFHVRHVLKSWLSRPEMWGLYGASY